MTFRLVARLTALVCAILFVVFLIAPQAYSPLYGVETSTGAQFMTRRAAPMFVAPMVILWAASNAPQGALRDAIALGIALLFAGVAATGVLAWAQGIAAPMILLAAVGEVLIATLIWTTRKN